MTVAEASDSRLGVGSSMTVGAADVWAEVSGLVGEFAAHRTGGDAAATLSGAQACGRAEAFLAWLQYLRAAELFDVVLADMVDAARAAGDGAEVELDVFDAHTQTAARLALSLGLSQSWAENLLAQGLALRDRLPQTGLCLRDGVITPAQARMVISRTELLDETEARLVDGEVAAAIRRRRGALSVTGIRNLADRLVFRIDPDAVRRARRQSVANRTTWNNPAPHGMANLGASMTAENAAIAHAAVHALAATACAHDRRGKDARASDAFFALLAGQRFTCDCDRADCAAQIPEAGRLGADGAGQIVVHVVADAATAAREADHPGFLDGYGVISGEHVQAILARPDSIARPLAARSTPTVEVDADAPGPLVEPTLPSHQRANPYRPSAALDAFIRIRDGYCTVPACSRSAFAAQVDHVVEYNHAEPAAGGATVPANLNSKCTFHHLLKTVGNWVDEQYVDADGSIRISWTTPEGVVIDRPAENNTDLFAGLARYHWHPPTPPTPTGQADPTGHSPTTRPRRITSRTERKHQRRRAERTRNRRERERDEPPY